MIKPLRLLFTIIVLFSILSFVLGCASYTDDEENSDINYVGFTNCYGCHADENDLTGSLFVFGDSNTLRLNNEGWLSGPHGNYESINQSHQYVSLDANNVGYPNYGYSGLGTETTCTTECHDPLDDGKKLENFYLATGLDSLGKINRPVIGCESCHGRGGNHYGIYSMPFSKPDSSRCGICHNNDFPDAHLAYHPEGDRIYEDCNSSLHAKSINDHIYVEEDSTSIKAKCSRCHTDEGAREYISIVNGTANYDKIEDSLDGESELNDASNIQCRTCHDAHNPDKLLGEKAVGLPSRWSSEFKTCTSCHQLLREDGSLLAEAYHDPSVNRYGNLDQIITDTHYDDPNTENIEGYIIDANNTHLSISGNNNSGTCIDCHNPHNADNTINRQWANSAHGGHIAKVKELDPNSPVTNSEGPGWTNYDFKNRSDGTCAYCHTATGFKNFANDPNNYNPANNIFVAKNLQKEMLYCWACHTSNVGNLRKPGIFEKTVSYSVLSDRIAKVSDLDGSNICLVCHSGIMSGNEISDMDFDTEINGKNFGSFNAHYLSAGGTLFRTTGYEYEGRDYANSYFKHNLIGTASATGTGTNGPCIGCHMQTEESHLFLSVEKDPNDQITEITSQDKTCTVCHQNALAITTDYLNELYKGYRSSLDALDDQLAANGIYSGSSYPYYFSDPNQQNIGTAYKNWPDKDTLGAAFNLCLLIHEPGAYIHNQLYTRRLIFDAIDFLDDGILNFSVRETLGSTSAAYNYLSDTR